MSGYGWTDKELAEHMAKFAKHDVRYDQGGTFTVTGEMVTPKRQKTVKAPSKADLAMRFQCKALGLPDPVAEFRFHETRRWRFDYAFPAEKVALEIDGGVFMDGGGRHTRGSGYRDDCEKLAEAAILGWRVIRCLPEQVIDGTATLWLNRAIKGV